jgi:AraC-like DNA-binding protein
MLTDITIPDLMVASVLLLTVALGFFVSVASVFRRLGNQKSNLFFALLLFLFSLAVLNNLFIHLEYYLPHQHYFHLPLWYTLAFGPSLFYFIKFALYPSYKLRWTDGKHFLLPLVQLLFYWILWFTPRPVQLEFWGEYMFPVFKTVEGLLFVISFFSYLAISYRYIKFKRAILKKTEGFQWERRKVAWLKRSVKVLIVLTIINTFYIIADFIAYNYFALNLYNSGSYSYLGDLSFAAMLIWLGYRGLKNEFGVTYQLKLPAKSLPASQQLVEWIESEKWYLDSELKIEQVAKALHLSKGETAELCQAQSGRSFPEWIDQLRVNEVKDRLNNPRYRNFGLFSIGYESGFGSRAAFYKTFHKATGMSPSKYRGEISDFAARYKK